MPFQTSKIHTFYVLRCSEDCPIVEHRKMELSDLLILYAYDAKSITEDLIQQLPNVPVSVICIDDPSPQSPRISSHPALENAVKSRIQVVFFSPGFLSFIDSRPGEAYGAFKNLDPLSTMAIFCEGLTEQDVRCYHTTPLKSFNSWPKFKVHNRRNGNTHIFPRYLLQRIEEIFPNDKSMEEDIVIVPELINKACSTIFLIFTKGAPDASQCTVCLEGKSRIYIAPGEVNAYVMKFKVPEMLIENSTVIRVKMQQSDKLLIEKVLHVVQESDDPNEPYRLTCRRQSNTSTENFTVEKQWPHLLSPAKSLEMEPFNTDLFQTEEDRIKSLAALCRRYGFEQLSLFMNDAEDSGKDAQNSCNNNIQEPAEAIKAEKIRHARNLHAMDSLQTSEEDVDGFPMGRSQSLPSLLPSPMELNDDYGDYLPMNPILKAKMRSCIPTTENYPEGDEMIYSRSNDGYVYMKFAPYDSLELLKKDLSKSQQELLELMHAFKKGSKTISDVEEEFQSWHRRHGVQLKEEEMKHKIPASFLPDWKQWKSGGRTTNVTDTNRRLPGLVRDGSLQGNTRKISTASVSSTSSKASDSSNYTIQYSRGTAGEVCTGFMPHNSTSRECPVYQGGLPPPLPSTPRPPMSKSEMSKLLCMRNRKLPEIPVDEDDEEENVACDNRYEYPEDVGRLSSPFLEKCLAEQDQCEIGKKYQKPGGEVPTHRKSSHPIVRECPLYVADAPPPLPSTPRPGSTSAEMLKKRKLPEIPVHEDNADHKAHDDDNAVITGPEDQEEQENINALMEFYQKYGLQELQSFIIKEAAPIYRRLENKILGEEKDEGFSPKVKNKLDPSNFLQIPSTELGGEESHYVSRRPLSFPNCLYSMDMRKQTESVSDYLDVELSVGNPTECEESPSFEDYCISSITSNIYMSVKSQNEESSNLSKNTLSSSQQELLEMMHDFKTGERTMSEVEQQFQQWLSLHMGTSTQRQWELAQLKEEYEKVKKPAAFWLPDIRSFILRKPKKKSEKMATSDDRRCLEKQNSNAYECESTQIGQMSCTSASSGISTGGISDNSEVFHPNCYFNPGYAFFREPNASGSSTPRKFSSSSHEENRRPLPPPPLPAAALKFLNLTSPIACSVKNDVPSTESNPSTADENSPSASTNPKPVPPPKPKNVPEILNCNDEESPEDDKCKENEGKEDELHPPDSPPYIEPNPARFFPGHSKKTCNAAKKKGNLQDSSRGKTSLDPAKKSPDAVSRSPKDFGNDPAKTLIIKRQIFKLANQWIKLKKTEQAMFYVGSHRWNSFLDLEVPPIQPTYLEIIGSPVEKSESTDETTEKTE